MKARCREDGSSSLSESRQEKCRALQILKKDYVQIANDTDYKSGDRKSQRSALLTRRRLTIRGTSIPQKIPVPKYLSACTRWSEERKQTQGPSARVLFRLI